MRKILVFVAIVVAIVGIFALVERLIVMYLFFTMPKHPVMRASIVKHLPTVNKIIVMPTETPQQVVWDKDLTSVVNPSNNTTVITRVEKLIENYAIGIAGNNSAAYTWYAVESNGRWQEVWQGQTSIPCKVVRDFNIPKDLYGGKCASS